MLHSLTTSTDKEKGGRVHFLNNVCNNREQRLCFSNNIYNKNKLLLVRSRCIINFAFVCTNLIFFDHATFQGQSVSFIFYNVSFRYWCYLCVDGLWWGLILLSYPIKRNCLVRRDARNAMMLLSLQLNGNSTKGDNKYGAHG